MTTLQDRADIIDLVYRLGACLDEHRFDDLRALFHEDATATTPGGTAQGPDAIVAQATRNHEEFDGLQHVISNVLVDAGSDLATARANIVGHFVRDKELVREIGGVYRFGLRRASDGWRFARLEVSPTWLVGEAPSVVATGA